MVCFSCMRYEIMTVALWGKGYEAPVLLGFKLSILLEYMATDEPWWIGNERGLFGTSVVFSEVEETLDSTE